MRLSNYLRLGVSSLIMGSVLFIAGCSDKEEEKPEVIRPVKALQVSHTTFQSRRFPGNVEASSAVTLAFEVSGKLGRIPVSVGDYVKKGGVLASLDPRDFKNELDSAKAAYKRASAQYGRVKQAADLNAVSKQELSNSIAEMEAAKATMNIKRKALSDSVLRAPYTGVVSDKLVSSFSNVSAKQEAIRFVDVSSMEMHVDIAANLIDKVRDGLKVHVLFDAYPGQEVSAEVIEISAEASRVTNSYDVTVLLDVPDSLLIRPGMAGEVWVDGKDDQVAELQDANEFQVPITAIAAVKKTASAKQPYLDTGSESKTKTVAAKNKDDDSVKSTADNNTTFGSPADGGLAANKTRNASYVWVIDEKTGLTEKRMITINSVTEQGVRIRGVKEGEFIAVAGVNTIKDKQKVRIIQ